MLTRRVWTSAFAAMLVGVPVLAQDRGPAVGDPAPDRQGNAALKYWAAWSVIPQETTEKVNNVEWKGIETTTDPAKLPASFHEAAQAVDGAIVNGLVNAASYETCDFEIEYDKGFDAVLPHLSKARQAARILRLDARAKHAAGDIHAASRDVAAIYRLAAHLAQDEVLISGLVSAAIAALADQEAELLAAGGRLTAADRDAILAAMDRADPADPFGTKRGVAAEQRIGTEWIIATFKGPDAGRRFATTYLMTANEGPGPGAGGRERVATMNGETLAREAGLYGAAIGASLEAWSAPDAPARLAQVEEQMSAGKYGVLGAVLAPAFTKAHAADTKARAARARVLELLRNARAGG